MATHILGISCYYHDASAALLKDGVVVAAALEERFTRKKHDTSFPVNAVNYCLAKAGITASDLAYVGFYEKPFLKFERLLSQHLEMFPRGLKTFVSALPSWLNEKLRVPRSIKKKLGYRGDVFFVEHHLAHAASSFLVSPFDAAAIVTADGVGEWTTTSYGVGNGNEIHLMKEIRFPHSLGLLYSTVTTYLGFRVNDHEYRVMGLAAYGDMNRNTNPYYPKLRQVIDLKEDGSYRLNMDYFVYHYRDRMPAQKLCELLGGPPRGQRDDMTPRHKDIAAAVQLIYEEVMLKMLRHVERITNQENVVIAGGCGLNSVCNGKILRNTAFKKIWIQPDAGDGGTSLGVASYVYHAILDNPRHYVLEHAYLGPSFTTQEIKAFLDQSAIRHRSFRDQRELIKETAQLIYENRVIGWFQTGMEWGPRALGARSILSNPCNPEMKDILNLKVKHREPFRPFAPVVCEEDAATYFDCDRPVPRPADFMLMVYPIKPEYRAKLPAVTHADGSGRLQTIRRSQNSLYYDLIKAFGKLSGIPILINTSFNIRGEPIVCTPFDAYKCMMGTGIDYLILDRFLIKREDNLRHMWDSEKYISD